MIRESIENLLEPGTALPSSDSVPDQAFVGVSSLRQVKIRPELPILLWSPPLFPTVDETTGLG